MHIHQRVRQYVKIYEFLCASIPYFHKSTPIRFRDKTGFTRKYQTKRNWLYWWFVCVGFHYKSCKIRCKCKFSMHGRYYWFKMAFNLFIRNCFRFQFCLYAVPELEKQMKIYTPLGLFLPNLIYSTQFGKIGYVSNNTLIMQFR